MKGSAITGPVGKEAAELWPVGFQAANLNAIPSLTFPAAYSQQFWGGNVSVGRALLKGLSHFRFSWRSR